MSQKPRFERPPFTPLPPHEGDTAPGSQPRAQQTATLGDEDMQSRAESRQETTASRGCQVAVRQVTKALLAGGRSLAPHAAPGSALQ